MRLFDPAGIYTPTEVVTALEAVLYGTREFEFRFERLDATNALIAEMETVSACTVSNNQFADIKRVAKFSIRDGGAINYLSDRIKPYVRLRMDDGGFVEWGQGVFLLSTPSRVYSAGASLMREVEGYDQLLVLRDEKVNNRTTFTSGSAYTTNITAITSGLGFTTNITPSALTLPADREWEPGTSRLQILNDLLGAINYESAFFDEDGVLVCQPYISPADRASEYTYRTNEAGLISGNITQTLDLFDVPNEWTITVSNPDQAALTSTYTNTSISSPTSTVSRGRTISDFRTEEEAADQTTLDAKVARIAFEASQVYEVVEFATAMMPVHQNADVYSLDIDGLSIDAAYSEHEWSMTLKAGATMTHKVRRVVTVS